MILTSPERIKEYTEKGYWGEKNLLDCFREYARKNPEKVALSRRRWSTGADKYWRIVFFNFITNFCLLFGCIYNIIIQMHI